MPYGRRMALDVRTMSADDLTLVLGWARDEGWNPGVDDAPAFLAADPGGFLLSAVDGEPAASISLVRYGGFAFLGLYIVTPARRGQGHGLALWQHALDALPAGTVVGLDGVVAEQENYRRSGFVLAHRNARWGGPLGSPADLGEPLPEVRLARPDDLAAIAAYDADLFPAPRDAFLAAWLTGSPTRQTRVHVEGGRVRGYGTVRLCHDGWKIGPLVADSSEIAGSLLAALAGPVAPGPVFVDVPEPNDAAVALVTGLGLTPSFETARMYRGADPGLPLDRIFGITTLELG